MVVEEENIDNILEFSLWEWVGWVRGKVIFFFGVCLYWFKLIKSNF